MLAIIVAACSSDPTAAGIIVSVTITPKRDTIGVGETSLRLAAVAKNAGGDVVPNAAITWKSDQPFLAAVDSLTGAVKGLDIGAAAITAQVGTVRDTAQVFVVSPVSLAVALDTIVLAPGDTMTIPVELSTRSGSLPALSFGGGTAAIATVSTSGLVTAVGAGFASYYVVADTFSANGVVEVLTLPDTSGDGVLTVHLSHAITRTATLAVRGYNYPTLDNGKAFQVAAVNPDTSEDHLTLTLLETITGPVSRAIAVLPSSSATDPVCHPPGTWAFYRLGVTGIRALSQSGTLTITSATALTGGFRVSGRFEVTFKRIDALADPNVPATAIGTFVMPVTTLAKCPQ